MLRWATLGWLGITLLFIAAPTLIAIVIAFSSAEVVKFPPDGFTLKWFASAWGKELFWRAALVSLLVALAAMAITVPAGVAAALAIRRSSVATRRILELVFMSPLLVPAIVLSLAILVGSVLIGATDAPLRLWAAHTVIVLPYVVRTTLASLAGMPPGIEEAAATQGASPWQVFRYITLPLITPGVFAGAAFAFIISFDNVSVSLFLVNQKTPTLPLAIMNYVEYNFDPSVAAISTTMVALSLAVAWLVERMVGLRRILQ